MIGDLANQNLTEPETEENLTIELLSISEDPSHPLHLCTGLLVHEIRGIWKKFNEEYDSEKLNSSLLVLKDIVEQNIKNQRALTGEDLLRTFSYSKNTLIIPPEIQFQNIEQFLCVRTLVDNSLVYGDCVIKGHQDLNIIDVIDSNGKAWKEGYWDEVETAHEVGLSWNLNERFVKAVRGKKIVATIMGIRKYPVPREIKAERIKGIRLSFNPDTSESELA